MGLGRATGGRGRARRTSITRAARCSCTSRRAQLQRTQTTRAPRTPRRARRRRAPSTSPSVSARRAATSRTARHAAVAFARSRHRATGFPATIVAQGEMRREIVSRQVSQTSDVHAIASVSLVSLSSFPSEQNHQDRVFPSYSPHPARIITLVHTHVFTVSMYSHCPCSIHTPYSALRIHRPVGRGAQIVKRVSDAAPSRFARIIATAYRVFTPPHIFTPQSCIHTPASRRKCPSGCRPLRGGGAAGAR